MNIYTIKPIKTEADYQQALHEIESLFEAQSNTPEGDRLDVLTTLIEAYENKQGYTLPFPDPIEAIRYYMESRGLSVDDLSQCLGDYHMVRNIDSTISVTATRRLSEEIVNF